MSNLSAPTADQLAAARTTHWHQNAEPILTINMLRDWLNASGLVFYAPRAAQLPAPAPSFVEAIFGAANPAPALADIEQARSLLQRLIADGGAIPLNLLGNPTGAGTETPDFIVSPLAFPYLFTLRGDKTWKQPPATSGAAKVSPLALATYNLLAEKVTLSAYDLVTQLGKEVTEAAVLRALTELWQHLRVLPIPQPDGAPTQWELTTTRFTKQIKAGANAGQPTALSALISLYLGQAIVASEEDIETFLSPVAARSRIRDVIHALLAARQLETIVVEGRTVLHVAGDLPAFLAAPVLTEVAPDAIEVLAAADAEQQGETPRITKFIPKPRKTGTGFVTKPVAKPFAAEDRERRPFTRTVKPSFTKPWDEEKRDTSIRRPKSFHAAQQSEAAEASAPPHEPTRPTPRKPSFDREVKRPSFGNKRPYESRPAFDRSGGGDRGPRPGKPSFRREESADTRPPRKTFSKPGTFARKREGFGGKPSFDRTGSFGESRPPRREFSAGKPAFSRDRSHDDRGPRSGPPFRKFDAPRGKFASPRSPRREDAERPARPARSFSGEGSANFEAAPRRTFGARKPFARSAEGFAGKAKSFERKEKSSSFDPNGKAGFTGSKPYGKKPFAKSDGKFASKPGGKFSGKSTGKSFGKSEGRTGKPASTFDKFKGNKKPFGKRPPSRKFKPEKGESAE